MKNYFNFANFNLKTAILPITALTIALVVACGGSSDTGTGGDGNLSADDIRFVGIIEQFDEIFESASSAAPSPSQLAPFLNDTLDSTEPLIAAATAARSRAQSIPDAEFSEARYLQAVRDLPDTNTWKQGISLDETTSDGPLQIYVNDQLTTEADLLQMFYMSKANAIAVLDAYISVITELKDSVSEKLDAINS